MSQHECPVVRVTIEPHPNADAIELARVGGYVCIVQKGQFKDGDLAVYIPEQSVLPEWMLRHMGFWDDLNAKGKLSGSAGNRVRAIKLRGVLSQGLLWQVDSGSDCGGPFINGAVDDSGSSPMIGVHEGYDAAADLGVTKYQPEVPKQMDGKVAGGDLDATCAYDFENIKKHPSLFAEGDRVVFTEKLHGTFVQIGLIPEAIYKDKPWADKVDEVEIGGHKFRVIITSKGQGAKGLMLDPRDEGNLYIKVIRELAIDAKFCDLRANLASETFNEDVRVPLDSARPVFLLGEIHGAGVQKGFDYGLHAEPMFRAFDIAVGTRGAMDFIPYRNLRALLDSALIAEVPEVYRGGFSQDMLNAYTDGVSMFGDTIREGIVIKSMDEVPHVRYGRRIAKSISEDYLMLVNKGKTTEFQ